MPVLVSGSHVNPRVKSKTVAPRKRRTHVQAESPCGLGIDDQLKFRRLHHRQVRRLRALEDATKIGADPTIRIGKVACVTHQPASFGMISPGIALATVTVTPCY